MASLIMIEWWAFASHLQLNKNNTQFVEHAKFSGKDSYSLYKQRNG